MAINTWGTLWQHKNCDDRHVMNVSEKGTCKSPDIMALVRMIRIFCAAITSMFVFNTFLVSGMIYCRCSFSFPGPPFQKNVTKGLPTPQHHLCLASPSLHCYFLQYRCTVSPSQLGTGTNPP